MTVEEIIEALKAREAKWEKEEEVEGLMALHPDDVVVIQSITQGGLEGFLAMVELAKPPEK